MPIALEPASQDEVVALINELDAYQKPLYPPESHHGISIKALSASNVLFAVARDDEGQAVGCGAIVPLQPEAIALYERCGYRRRGPFGAYSSDPNSVFMHKLAPSSTGAAM